MNTVGNDEEGMKSTEDQGIGLSPISLLLTPHFVVATARLKGV